MGAADAILVSSSAMKQNLWITVSANRIAQIVVMAVRVIVGRDNGPSGKQPNVMEGEIEIQDDGSFKTKTSLEEIYVLEVISLPYLWRKSKHFQVLCVVL